MSYSKYRVERRFFCSDLGVYFPVGAEVWYDLATRTAKMYGVPRSVHPSGSVSSDDWDITDPGGIDGWFRGAVISTFFVFIGTVAGTGSGQVVPTVVSIDEHNGIVTLANPTDLQIEVWKYTRKGMADSNENKGVIYPDHHGKRYKRFMQLPMGATTWTIHDRWYRENRRNYFKFALRLSATESTPLTQETISTAMLEERESTRTKIFLIRHN